MNDKLPEQRIPYPVKNFWNIVPIGVGAKLRDVTINLEAAPNILVAGAINKNSNLLNAVVAHCIKSKADWKLYGIDLAERGVFEAYRVLPITAKIALEYDEALEVLEDLLVQMNHRYSQNVQNSHRTNVSPILLIVEDLGLSRDREIIPLKITLMIGELARLGGEVGIHLLASMKEPNETVLHPAFLQNFQCRIKLKDLNNDNNLTTKESNLIFNGESIASQYNSGVIGRGLVQIEGTKQEFQCYDVPFALLVKLNDSVKSP